jgi:Cft2 family RNA processing exonuclease
MNITFLGGGDEIGASCAIVEIGATRILVDCGIRMSGDDRLPDLAAVRNSPHLNHLDAALLTHAHMDHSGALPVLHQHFPQVPVYCTAATRGLVEALLRDSLNIMRGRAETERELPLYARGAVESLIEKMVPVPFGSPAAIGRAGVTATWFPAGHILGAASVGIEGVEQGRTVRVLFSGDISVADQLTVPGMLAPKGFRPDVLVIESTYGDRLHAARALEERRLLEMVAAIIERQGKLLIPAFAVGRAQEVILTLLREFRARRLASFPVYVDGMVRTVCQIYSSFPAHQTPFARRLIERHGDPFFNIVDEVRAVATLAEREKVLAGPPCCIIASSGMLTGGASAYYAPVIASDERNGIAITGYQDEESPGRQLLDLAEGKAGQINIGGRVVEVKSSVAKYALSAHADANEIAGLVEAINPRHVVLVHGEGMARQALADTFRRAGGKYRPVHMPRNGDTLSFGATRRFTTHAIERASSGFGGGDPLTPESLARLADEIRRRGEERIPLSEIDLLNLWYGQGAWNEEQYSELIKLLDESDVWRRHPSRPHLYRVRQREESAAAAPVMFYAEPNALLQRVEAALGPEAGLYRKGYDIQRHELRLSFYFPPIARERFRALLTEMLENTGWTYSINDWPHQGRLAEVAIESLPAGVVPVRAPALRMDEQEVAVAVDQPLPVEAREKAAAKFREITGYKLTINAPGEPAPQGPQTFLSGAGPGAAEPVEINLAYKMIEDEFKDAPETWRPYRKSLKSDGGHTFIELAFISPQIGQRQCERIEQLARKIRRPLRIKPEPNQIALIEVAARLVPREWRLQKQPSVHKSEGVIRLKCLNAPAETDPQWIELGEKFEALTGYRLEKQ